MPFEFTLDARDLAPPEPFERATHILRQLQPGQYLRMLHRRVPYPLFDVCCALSLVYSVSEDSAAPYEILIYFAQDEPQLREAGLL